MKLNITGSAYKHPALEVNNQRCVNLFPMSPGPDGRGKAPLVPTAGLELLVNLGSSPIRSMKTVGAYVYVVSGASVYRLTVDEAGRSATSSLLGTLSTSSGPVSVAANPTQIIWVDGTNQGYIYTPGAGTFAVIADGDFPAASQVVFIDGYFMVNEVGTGIHHVSALNNGTSWDPADVATAESGTDNINGLGVAKGEVWVFGDSTTEIWYNAANVSGSPFSPRDGLEMQVGCGAPSSIVVLNDLLIWMDNRGFIVQSEVSPFIRSNNSGYDLKIVSDEAITAEILSYSDRTDAIAMGYNDRGHLMYQISFPTAKKTWVFDYTSKSWHERAFYSEGLGEYQHHLGQFYAQFGATHLMAGVRSGKVYISDTNVYVDDSVPIRRIRTTAPVLDSETFREIGVDGIEIKIGIGDSTASSPQVSLRYSHDGGHTWSDYLARNIGSTGEYGTRITWNRLGTGHEWVFEFSIVENMPFAIIDAVLNTE